MTTPNTSSGESKINSYGFVQKEGEKDAAGEYEKVVERRASRWAEVFGESLGSHSESEGKVKRFIRKGIPPHLRGKLWPLISGADVEMSRHPREYERLSKVEASVAADRQIDLDLHRTFPDNENFRNVSLGMQESLSNILHCVATKHPSIGYCQGLNYIAGLLLLVTESEESSFWILETQIREISDYYTSGMRGLRVDVCVLRELLRQRCKELDALFDRLGFDLLLVCSKWFICWFMEVLPLQTVLRIWDCLFHEGTKILFRVALTLLLKNKSRLLQVKSFPEMVETLQGLTSDQYAHNAHELCLDLFSVPGSLSSKSIQQLRVKYSEELRRQK